MKKILPFFLVIIILLPLTVSSQAAKDRPLEIEYPEIEGEKPEQVTTPVPEYVKYIFNFFIWIAGIIALVVLINAGFTYFTSAGSPESIREAKDQIAAALLGLLILFGSYLILIFINPGLVVFHLPRIRPIISELTPGVLACREEVKTEEGKDAVLRAWDLIIEYKFENPTIDREKEIQKEMDLLLDKIALDCYTVLSKGIIRPDFDNKVKFIYFIPHIEVDEKGKPKSATEYGAIIYEDSNFKGFSKVLASNLMDPEGEVTTYREEASPLKPSSIKPFKLIYDADENWEVILYQEYNENRGVDLEPKHCKIIPYSLVPGDHDCKAWWCIYILPWPPKSVRVEGNLLAILCKDPGKITTCDTFSNGVYNDLEDPSLNTIDWVPCSEYYSEHERPGEPIGMSGPIIIRGEKECAQAAAKSLLILSASIY